MNKTLDTYKDEKVCNWSFSLGREDERPRAASGTGRRCLTEEKVTLVTNGSSVCVCNEEEQRGLK